MNPPTPDDLGRPGSHISFATTQWGLILAAKDRSAPESREALEALCSCYWYPLYAFVRRKGLDPDSAADLVQDFFARLLEKSDLMDVDPAKGRFRSFLMASCSHHLANRRDHDRALKRGGGRLSPSIDSFEAERRYSVEPAHDLTPERLFLRRWAMTLLDGVLIRLAEEQDRAGKGTQFEILKPALLGESDAAGYRDLGQRLGLSEGATRVAAHRLRARYREILREEVARTVVNPDEVDEEIRDLFAAVTG